MVALIITIIVLIILAGVSLSVALGENGIFKKSKSAVDTYQDSAKREESELDKAFDTMESLDPNSLASKVKVGDYVNYTPKAGEKTTIPQGSYNGKTAGTFEDVATINENGEATAEGVFGSGYSSDQTFTVPTDETELNKIKWRVLSIEDGCVNLISEKEIGRNGQWTGDWADTLYLQDITGYAYAEDVINEVCSIYGTGDGAKNARSINVEDVNKLTGYDVMNDSDYRSKYGKPVQLENYDYSWNWIYYAYNYNKSGLNLRTESQSSIEYKLIFDSDLYGNYANYWLGGQCGWYYSDQASFRVWIVEYGGVNSIELFECYPNGSANYNDCEKTVRPLVTLKSTVKAGESTTENGITTWNMDLSNVE